MSTKKIFHQESSTIKRVVLFGPESTGKTTLCKDLATHYNSVWVPEFARDFLQQKMNKYQQTCSLEDLITIAKGQMDLENEQLKKANRVLFCDTNVLVTKIWSETHFDGYCDYYIKQAVNQVHYTLYLLTDIDVPWELDDLRDRPNERQQMFNYFKDTLNELNLPYVFITGGREIRKRKAIDSIDALL